MSKACSWLIVVSVLLLPAALSARAELWVADNFGSQVLKYDDTTGAPIGASAFIPSGSGGLTSAIGIRLGPDGNLYVASEGSNAILRYNRTTGAFIDTFISNTTTLGATLNGPADLRFQGSNLYVSNFLGASVDRFDATTGAALGPFATDPQLNGASYATFGPDGNLYVSSFNTSKVLRFNGSTGAFMDVFASTTDSHGTSTGLNGPAGLAFKDGKLYVASLLGQQVLRFDGTTPNSFIDVFASPAPQGANQGFPSDLRFRPDGSGLLNALTGQAGVIEYDAATGAQKPFFATGGGMQVPGEMLLLPDHTWGNDANGNWSDGAKWVGGEPNGAGVTANFLDTIGSSRTVTLDAAKTVGRIVFDNFNTYTLAGASQLTFDAVGPSIHVARGSHVISAPMAIAAGKTLTKTGTGTLTISGVQSHGAGSVLTTTAGTLNLNSDGGTNLFVKSTNVGTTVNFGSTQHLAGVNVTGGGTAALTQNGAPGFPSYIGSNKYLQTKSLLVATGSTLDITNNALVVDYTGGSSPLATITAAITSGAHVVGGIAQWDGSGITSSTAHGDVAANPASPLTALGVLDLGDPAVNPGYDHVNAGDFNSGGPGEALPASAVLVKYTYLGDSQLAGKVQFSDFLVWKAAFSANLAGGHVGGWAHAQFDYGEAQTTFADFLIWKNSFSKALAGTLPMLHAGAINAPLGLSAVPEPSGLMLTLIGLAVAIIGARRAKGF